MVTSQSLDEIYNVSIREDLAEVGGAHNQKGVDFQRYWALVRMFELEQEGVDDFLFLFEAIQDISILNSCTTPTSIKIYQVKKKDHGEWTWYDLTDLLDPTSSRNSKKLYETDILERIKNSNIGKLYANVIAFRDIKSEGFFVSNAGCNLTLENGENAANYITCNLSSLSKEYNEYIHMALSLMRDAGISLPDPGRINLLKVSLPVDDPETYLIGKVCNFLLARSPGHAGQASALVDSLISKIIPLGRTTSICSSFDELREQKGYSRSDFLKAISSINKIPDYDMLVKDILECLRSEGMSFIDVSNLRCSITNIYHNQLIGVSNDIDEPLILCCDEWLEQNSISNHLLPLFMQAYEFLAPKFREHSKERILAHFTLRVIRKCVNRI